MRTLPALVALAAVSSRKLLRFFQDDNKLDAVARADLTRQIPLAP